MVRRITLFSTAAVAGLALGYLSRKVRRRVPMPTDTAIEWKCETKKGTVRVTADGLWVVNSFYKWEEVLSGTADNKTVLVALTVSPYHLNVVFNTADDALELLSHFRRKLYPDQPYTVHCIVNPKSGNGSSKHVLQNIVMPALEASPHTANIYYTERQGHALEITENLVLNSGDVIVVVSGDGVLHEVVNALAERDDVATTDIRLAVIPTGSGNGIAASLGIRCPRQAVNIILKGKETPLDAFTFTTETESKFGILSVTYGIIADVDIDSEWLRGIGSLRFMLYTIKAIFKMKRFFCRFKGGPESDHVGLFCITNASHLSFETCISPQSRVNDGLLNLQYIDSDKLTRMNSLKTMIKIDSGEHLQQPNVTSKFLADLSVEVDPRNKVVLDGELVSSEDFTVKIIPGMLRILSP
eukprot:TRINITY_DN2114_c0_g2_i1.p1 TRINITY_DN2114_c0_g2~~TRINITY_DN2114_c0_g2_i1.p1  ORF type:complete len:413 (+),score=50.59 TRINITY_DN2114_c0_g2_i1:127-1365(+)